MWMARSRSDGTSCRGYERAALLGGKCDRYFRWGFRDGLFQYGVRHVLLLILFGEPNNLLG